MKTSYMNNAKRILKYLIRDFCKVDIPSPVAASYNPFFFF